MPPILSKPEFLKDFVPPDYLIDGVLQRRFVYSLTARTGDAKTALALLMAQQVACPDEGAILGRHRVEKGHVIYFVGENPDDVRMRVIGSDSLRGDDASKDRITFIPGVFNIGEMAQMLTVEIGKRGGADLVIIDTSAAYFLGNEELSNTQMGTHARMLRALTTLPGGPCVLVLCHPIKHATEPSHLVPRGGGAFLAEMDGNLTLWRTDEMVELHHYGKFRGPGFEPMTLRIEKITSPKLVDKKGRLIPTVRVVPVSESEEAEQAQAVRGDEDALLAVMLTKSNNSVAKLAHACGWTLQNGEPHKSKVHRILEKLSKAKPKLVVNTRDGWELTEEGERAAKKTPKVQDRIDDHGGAGNSKQAFRPNVGERVRAGVPCAHCQRTDGDIFRIGDGRVKKGHREALHKDCARPFFEGEFYLDEDAK